MQHFLDYAASEAKVDTLLESFNGFLGNIIHLCNGTNDCSQNGAAQKIISGFSLMLLFSCFRLCDGTVAQKIFFLR